MIRREVLLCSVVVLLHAIVLRAEPTGAVNVGGNLAVLELDGDVVIDKALTVENRHVRIRGNLILAKGGELTLKNCYCELLCNYAREFIYEWRGGVLRTENVTIGGTDHHDYFAQANFHLFDGEWHAIDTTVRLSYGIVFNDTQ